MFYCNVDSITAERERMREVCLFSGLVCFIRWLLQFIILSKFNFVHMDLKREGFLL